MFGSNSLHTEIAVCGTAAITVAGLVIAPLAPIIEPSPPPAVVQRVELAATTVPLGGLFTSFLHNQTVYCSIICPLLVQTGVTAVTTTLQAPGTFLAALSAGDVLKAIGTAAASVTGPTEAAAVAAIDADAAIPAQRALNAFEVGVVGLLNIGPAVTRGLPAAVAAVNKARQDTYDALNAPFVPNPKPTVMPRGVFQVAVIGAINVVAAVIFPAFNAVLAGVFQVPDAVAKELAASGNPIRAVAAGVQAAAGVVKTAGTAVSKAIVKAVDDVREEADKPAAPEVTAAAAPAAPKKKSTPATTTLSLATEAPHPVKPKRADNHVREAVSNLRHAVHNIVKKVTAQPHRNTAATESAPAQKSSESSSSSE